jgi:hypothetical protein
VADVDARPVTQETAARCSPPVEASADQTPTDDAEPAHCPPADADHLTPCPLADLASRINAEHEQGVRSALSALEHIRKAGVLLLEAKGLCPHGDWLAWLEHNIRFGARQAQKYMRLAESWDEIAANATSESYLRIESALALIAETRQRRIRAVVDLPDPPAADTAGGDADGKGDKRRAAEEGPALALNPVPAGETLLDRAKRAVAALDADDRRRLIVCIGETYPAASR